jgi:hypothetical protein
MKAPVSLSLQLSLFAGLAFAGLLAVSLWQGGCKEPEKPKVAYDTYTCRDRTVDVDANSPTNSGVDEDTVVVCPKHKIKWQEKNKEDWVVEFTVSPFQGGEKTIKKGDPPPSPVAPQPADTAFKYSITVNGTKHDPQIIIMGG